MKKILAILTVMVLVLTLAGCGNDESAPAGKESRTSDNYNSVEIGDMIFQVPDYYEGDDTDGSESMTLYAEKGEGLSFISLTPMDIQSDEGDFSANYEAVADAALETIFGSSGSDDSHKVDSSEFRTSEGLQASETNFVYHLVSDDVDVPLDGKLILINNRDHNKVIMAYLLQSNYSEYDYADGFIKMINEAETTAVGSDSAEGAAETDSGDSDLLSPEFKKTMDDYEAWFDHYCDVMKKYQENPSDIELLSEMTTLLSEETTMLEQMENMDESEMNAAELAYYIDVTARIEKKLLEVTNY